MSELLDDVELDNWVKGTVALKITRSGVTKFVELKWKEKIRSWSSEEIEHLSVFLEDIHNGTFTMTVTRERVKTNESKSKPKFITKPNFKADCNHELCLKLAERITPENPKNIVLQCNRKPGDYPKGEECYWELAKMFMLGNPEETTKQTCPDDTEHVLVFKMMKNCDYLFVKDDEQYDKILKVRNSLMHSPTNKLTPEELHEYVSDMKNFLKSVHENECKICELTNVKDTCEPTDVKDACEPTDVKDTSEPSDVKDACEPTDIKDASEPTDVKDTSEPIDVKDASKPTDVKDTCEFQQKINSVNNELDEVLSQKTLFERRREDLEMIKTALEEQRKLLEWEKKNSDKSELSSSTLDLILEANKKRTTEYKVFITKFETIYRYDNPGDRKKAYEEIVENYQKDKIQKEEETKQKLDAQIRENEERKIKEEVDKRVREEIDRIEKENDKKQQEEERRRKEEEKRREENEKREEEERKRREEERMRQEAERRKQEEKERQRKEEEKKQEAERRQREEEERKMLEEEKRRREKEEERKRREEERMRQEAERRKQEEKERQRKEEEKKREAERRQREEQIKRLEEEKRIRERREKEEEQKRRDEANERKRKEKETNPVGAAAGAAAGATAGLALGPVGAVVGGALGALFGATK